MTGWWMSKATLKLIKKREVKWKKYRNLPSTNNYEEYTGWAKLRDTTLHFCL